MKAEIRVGDISSNKRVKYPVEKLDDPQKDKARMYQFLSDCKNCIIEDVDINLMATLNNGLIAFNIKKVAEKEVNENALEEYELISKFDPDVYYFVQYSEVVSLKLKN